MSWSLKLIPLKKEATGVSVVFNGQFWNRGHANGEMLLTWRADEGETELPLPAEYKEANPLRITAVAYPKGKELKLEVLWEGRVQESVQFDSTEVLKLRP
jgi:hypothetical protein